jgi:hypothetical protein
VVGIGGLDRQPLAQSVSDGSDLGGHPLATPMDSGQPEWYATRRQSGSHALLPSGLAIFVFAS